MKKITTVTFQNAYNYGAILQCYALQKKLSVMGYDVSVLNYDNPLIGNRYKTIYISDLHRSKKLFIKNIINSTMHCKQRYKRAKNFKRFVEQNIKLTTKIKKSDFKGNEIDTDCYITGSDQVWNPDITKGFDDIYTLNFESNAKRISYAASIGESKFIEKYRNDYNKIVENMDYVSVRENDAKYELEKISSKDITITLDPTLLLERAVWDRLLKDSVNSINEKYICAYVVEPDKEYVKIVNELSRKTGLRVVHFGDKNPGYENVIKTEYTKGPVDFIKTIKNAEYVVTTSFHATVFSIIYNKNFFVIPHRKTGVRVTHLLTKLGIDNRIYYNYNEFPKDSFKEIDTDWNEVQSKLDKERTNSVDWLKAALEGE